MSKHSGKKEKDENRLKPRQTESPSPSKNIKKTIENHRMMRGQKKESAAASPNCISPPRKPHLPRGDGMHQDLEMDLHLLEIHMNRLKKKSSSGGSGGGVQQQRR